MNDEPTFADYVVATVISTTVAIPLLSVLVLLYTVIAFFLWNWFATSVFGAPTLTFVQTIPIGIVIQYLIGFSNKDDINHSNDKRLLVFKHMYFVLIRPFVLLLISYVVYRLFF